MPDSMPDSAHNAATRTDTSNTLQWTPQSTGVLPVGSTPRERAAAAPFFWPTPPFACYAPPEVQAESLACDVHGLNGSRTHGRLTFFVPEQAVAHIQVPPASRTPI
jgi:hypothetical protein